MSESNITILLMRGEFYMKLLFRGSRLKRVALTICSFILMLTTVLAIDLQLSKEDVLAAKKAEKYIDSSYDIELINEEEMIYQIQINLNKKSNKASQKISINDFQAYIDADMFTYSNIDGDSIKMTINGTEYSNEELKLLNTYGYSKKDEKISIRDIDAFDNLKITFTITPIDKEKMKAGETNLYKTLKVSYKYNYKESGKSKTQKSDKTFSINPVNSMKVAYYRDKISNEKDIHFDYIYYKGTENIPNVKVGKVFNADTINCDKHRDLSKTIGEDVDVIIIGNTDVYPNYLTYGVTGPNIDNNIVTVLYRYKYPYEVDYFLEGESEASYIVKASSYLDADIPYMDKASELVKYSKAFENVDEEGTVELLGTGKVSKNEESNKVKVTFKKSEAQTQSEPEAATNQDTTQSEQTNPEGEVAANEDDILKDETAGVEAEGEVAMEVAAEEVDVYVEENQVASAKTKATYEVAADTSQVGDSNATRMNLLFIISILATMAAVAVLVYEKVNANYHKEN